MENFLVLAWDGTPPPPPRTLPKPPTIESVLVETTLY